ncbi:phenylacetic acid degradation protein PaaN [Actinospica robiniae]|uniref:phenylacetic acid degradation protein PaaN n=1 Tax=Actinospica robiniae TaxID=304901 RepID=UPI00040B4100|nr:phenylacetic acid degradation protein PaaN [Actinospica robiniae]
MNATVADLIAKHRPTLDAALGAIRSREYYTRFPDSPKAYPAQAQDEALAEFQARRGRLWSWGQTGADGTKVGGERSPYGFDLEYTYDHMDPDVLLPAMGAAIPAWRDAGAEARAAVCIEILTRLNARTYAMAFAAMHTTGQAFMMAFQAAGPNAQDRGLEAVAYGFSALNAHPDRAVWEKPGKGEPVRLAKKWVAAPRGIALVVGCNTFPTWNGYPGLFASLVTGNAVVVKPHPRAVAPLALTVETAREVLAEAGFDADLVALAPEAEGEPLAKTLALRPEVRIVDFTGSNEFGDWLEQNARQAQVYTEKAGINTVIVDSFRAEEYPAALGHLAFSLSLYTAQMCTSPQNLLVPRDGIRVGDEVKSPEEFAADLGKAMDRLLGDDARANAILGAVVNPFVLDRLERAAEVGKTVLASRAVPHPEFPDATVRTPLIAAVDAMDAEVYTHEWFGPISFVITTDSTLDSIAVYRDTVKAHGALTAAVYSTSEDVLDAAEEATWEAGANLSINLTGPVYVNQSAAFSDYHGTGANPAANATYADHAFVAGRFRFIQSRRPA